MDRRTFAALAAGSGLLAAAGGLLPKAALAQSLRLTGAGASFPFPLYSTWFQAYSQATSGIEIDYQSDRQRRRREVVHQPHGRFRRQRLGDDRRADRPRSTAASSSCR